MKYKFVKVAARKGKPVTNVWGDEAKPCWLFNPQSVDQVIEHWNKYCAPIVREGSRQVAQIISGQTYYTHPTNQFRMAVEPLIHLQNPDTRCGGLMAAEIMLKVENEAYNGRIRDFQKGYGHKMFLSPDMRLQIYREEFSEVVDVVEQDVLTYPEESRPSLNDVRIIQWPGGEHYYAKIGKLDVVDSLGRQKWDSRDKAMDAAEWYIEENWPTKE